MERKDKLISSKAIRTLLWLIFGIFLIVFVMTGRQFYKEFMQYREAKLEYEEVNSLIVVPEEKNTGSGPGDTAAAEEAQDMVTAAVSNSDNAFSFLATEIYPSSRRNYSLANGSHSSAASDSPWLDWAETIIADLGILQSDTGPQNVNPSTMTMYESLSRIINASAFAERVAASGLEEMRYVPGVFSGRFSAQTAEDMAYITFPRLRVDFNALQSINSDFVGVLYFPALQMRYPVAHSQDNVEYLTRTFEGTRNSSGCIFMDAFGSPDLTDVNTFILGHNMRNLTMFGSLKTLETNDTLVPQNPYFYIYTSDRVYKYAIFSYYSVPVNDEMYNYYGKPRNKNRFSHEAEDLYDAFVEKAIQRSLYQADEDMIDFSKRPRIVTLTTCYGTGHINNFVVHGALIGSAKLETDDLTE